MKINLLMGKIDIDQSYIEIVVIWLNNKIRKKVKMNDYELLIQIYHRSEKCRRSKIFSRINEIQPREFSVKRLLK